MTNLIFKSIESNPKYMVSNKGHVINLNRHSFVKPILAGPKSYLRVNLEGKLVSVHRLVAKAFIPNPNNKPYVNHKNAVKIDNSVENLEWVTFRENEDHAVLNNLKSHGENRPARRLCNEDIPIIRKMVSDGNSQKFVADTFGVSKHTIYAITRGKNWKHIK